MATKGDNMSINLVGEKVKKLLEDNNLSIVGMILIVERSRIRGLRI